MWYKSSQFGAGYGEHWIDEDGGLMYADGDIGDMNHEAHVIQRAQSMIAGDGWNDSEFVNWQGFLEGIAGEIINAAKINPRLKNKIEKETGGDIYTMRLDDLIGYEFVDNELIRRGVNKELLSIANGRGNARLFGMKAWKWKRVMNNYIETFTLTPSDTMIIAKGLSEIVPEDENGNTKWNIEIVSNRKYFTGIPLMIIEKGPIAINNYSRKTSSSVSQYKTSMIIDGYEKGLNYQSFGHADANWYLWWFDGQQIQIEEPIGEQTHESFDTNDALFMGRVNLDKKICSAYNASIDPMLDTHFSYVQKLLYARFGNDIKIFTFFER